MTPSRTEANWIRPAAVAGMFYPADPQVLKRDLEGYLAGAGEQAGPAGRDGTGIGGGMGSPEGSPEGSGNPNATPAERGSPAGHRGTQPLEPVNTKALILPHAGYTYSGPVAASGYERLLSLRGIVARVVVVGPAHHATVDGIAASSASAFATPLGRVPMDTEYRDKCLSVPGVLLSDAAHAPEHSVEVHLPFIQLVLGDVTVLPLVAGYGAERVVARVLDELWGGPETVIIVSSDLSHYHEYAAAAALDRITALSILDLEPGGVGYRSACGAGAVRGLLATASSHGLHARLLDLRNSGDTAGGKEQVVGYGAFAFA